MRNTMKKAILYVLLILAFLPGCKKAVEKILEKDAPAPDAAGFVKYTIRKGQQYCDQSTYKTVETAEMKFVVKFDSTAIYQTALPENQYDINKLYGFSDNNADHHQYSARFGWRWSDNALRLFAYVYNEGVVTSKELALVDIGKEINCSIQVTNSSYLFTVNSITERMPRMAGTPKAQGYQLYPYFGGDEKAPHDVILWIRN
jgi:hypothetical protein